MAKNNHLLTKIPHRPPWTFVDEALLLCIAPSSDHHGKLCHHHGQLCCCRALHVCFHFWWSQKRIKVHQSKVFLKLASSDSNHDKLAVAVVTGFWPLAAIMTSFLLPSWQAFCCHHDKLSAAIVASYQLPNCCHSLLPSWSSLCCYCGQVSAAIVASSVTWIKTHDAIIYGKECYYPTPLHVLLITINFKLIYWLLELSKIQLLDSSISSAHMAFQECHSCCCMVCCFPPACCSSEADEKEEIKKLELGMPR